MEGRTDGLTQAFRCLDAMEGQDVETRVSLWRAALRYRTRDKAGPASGDYASRSPRALGGSAVGETAARDTMG